MNILGEKLNHHEIWKKLKSGDFSIEPDDKVIRTGIPELDELFSYGIKPGKLIEWGLPQGRNGRIFPILFLRNEIPLTIWIYADLGLDIYAPTWASHGIDLRRIFFIKCDDPVKKLKPLFLDDTFKIIVIDSPTKLSKGDISFISVQARANKQIIFLIRNYFLSPRIGNPFAHIRVNCSRNDRSIYSVNFIKGRNIKKILLTGSMLFNE
ncbi:MAG TPA: hypothetical protein VGA95_02860 [Thermodesulfobacteriota bacterium]